MFLKFNQLECYVIIKPYNLTKYFIIFGFKKFDYLVENNSITELSTKSWGDAGMYFVQITNSNNTTSITKKVMVERK